MEKRKQQWWSSRSIMCSLKIIRAPGLCGGALDCLSEREGRARVFVRLVGIVTDGITCWRAALGCVRWFGRCVLTVCDGLSAGVLARLRPHWEGVAAELATLARALRGLS